MVHGGGTLTTPDASEFPDAEAVERGRYLFAQDCQFIAGAPNADALPQPGLPEIAFAGRSNVGKSSLLNALTGRKTLARTSHTPGRTQQINFFRLADALMLVDLPGYGYARASKQKVRSWNRVMRDYLRGRPTLRRLCMLIDSRHGLKDVDRELMALMDEAAVSYQVVLTKADKAGSRELAAARDAVAREIAGHVAAHPDIIVTSARSGAGLEELRAAIAALASENELG